MAIQGSQLEGSPRTAAGRWRCVSYKCGAWFVTTSGMQEMPLYFVDSLDMNVSYSCCYIYQHVFIVLVLVQLDKQ